MKVLFTNSVTLNGGDAAIVRAMRSALTDALGEIDVVVYDTQPDVASRHNPDLTFAAWPYLRFTLSGRLRFVGAPLQRLNEFRLRCAAKLWGRDRPATAGRLLRSKERAAMAEYARADLLVSTGGTYLVETYPLAAHLLDFEVARALRRPLALYTQSLGPFRDRRNRRRIRTILRESDAVLLRDERSRQHVRELGADGAHVEVFADAAFALARPDLLAEAATRPLPRGDRLRVAIAVRAWDHFRSTDAAIGMGSFEAGIAAAVAHLVRSHEAEITFVSTCQGVPEYWTDDADVARRIEALLPADVAAAVRVESRHLGTDALIDLIAGYDVAIATRMHFAILALCAGVPVLPIAYEFKTDELFARLGAKPWVVPIEDVGAELFPRAVEDFLGELPHARAAVFERVAGERQSALDAARFVAARCNGQLTTCTGTK